MSLSPMRIQRRRTKGWKMPENTVSCSRPGLFGNPFRMIGDLVYVNASHRRKTLCPWVLFYDGPMPDGTEIRLFRECLMDANAHSAEPSLEPVHKEYFNRMRERLPALKGKNLSCFCPLNKPCHVDVLLELANN